MKLNTGAMEPGDVAGVAALFQTEKMTQGGNATRVSQSSLSRIANNEGGVGGTVVVVARNSGGGVVGAACADLIYTTQAVSEEERAPYFDATLAAYPGFDATSEFLYGPVVVAPEARGLGVMDLLIGQLHTELPAERKSAVFFVAESNIVSQRAHVKRGAVELARMQAGGMNWIVYRMPLGHSVFDKPNQVH